MTSSYDYNINNFISVLENTLNNASLVYEYAYDENGNIITETIITKDKNGNIINNEPTRED